MTWGNLPPMPRLASVRPSPAPKLGGASPLVNNLANSSGAPKPAATAGGLDYDLGNNVHMHLSIAGGAFAGGSIRH